MSVSCVDDPGADAVDACGGCSGVDAEVGESCGACGSGTWGCSADGAAVCEGDHPGGGGLCGGCDELSVERFASCDPCARWICRGNRPHCSLDPRLRCGPLSRPTDLRASTNSPAAVVLHWLPVPGAVRYEVEIDGSGIWSLGTSHRSYSDGTADAPTVTSCTGPGPTASTGTVRRHVRLECAGVLAAPGAERSYRVRALNESGPGPAAGPVVGHRSRGVVTYQWEWAPGPTGPFEPIVDARSAISVDTTAPSDGTPRWYRVRLSASSDALVYSDPVRGSRMIGSDEPWIAYEDFREGAAYLVSGDGEIGPVRLPGDPLPEGFASAPDFSPDGTRLAYGYNTPGRGVLRIFTLATGAHRDLAFDGEVVAVTHPDWSPAGRRIAFRARSAEAPLVWNLAVVNVESETLTWVTTLADEHLDERYVSAPAWAIDGTRLYFAAGLPGSTTVVSDVWVIGVDGGGAGVVRDSADVLGSIAVEPSGYEIMFRSGASAYSAVVRLGIAWSPSPGGIPIGRHVLVGETDEYAWCDYTAEPGRGICGRAVDGVQDIVSVDLDSGEVIANITRSPDVAEAHPNASPFPYLDLPLHR